MHGDMTSVWGHGQLLAFSGIDGPTSYTDGLCLRSDGRASAFAVVQPGPARLAIDRARPRACELASDHFELETGSGRTRGVLLDAWHLLVEGPVTVEGADARLQVTRGGNRTLVAVAHRARGDLLTADFDAALAARRWWVDAAARRVGLAGRAAGVKALRQLKGQVYAPEGIFARRWSTPDRWPHRGCWLWDSAFHAIGARHVDAALARDLIGAVLDAQRADGFIPIRSDPDGARGERFTQPPTLVLACWALSQSAPDPVWLRAVLPRLVASLDWDLRERDAGNGLPFWCIEGDVTCRSGESGMDNSSRFDAATRMEAVDFSSFLSLEYELAGRLWQRLGEPAEGERCRERHIALNALIRERLWDGLAGFFFDRDPGSGGFCPVRAVTGFLPLICGAATPDQVDRLAALVDDPRAFGTALPLPSVARSDAGYVTDMWRGPVWVNMVWLVAAGFGRCGRTDLAARLRRAMAAEIERWHASHGTLFEFYDADGLIAPDRLKRKGRLAPEASPYHQCFHDYGWTGTLYLDMVLAGEEPLPDPASSLAVPD